MSGIRRQEVAAITTSGAKGKALVSALEAMKSSVPPKVLPKKKN